MKIPVFVSCPTDLNLQQDAARKIILRLLSKYKLEPRALGRSDYPAELPLKEIYVIARRCAGAVILGFEQFRATSGIWKAGTSKEQLATSDVLFPTPWNGLEAGILFGMQLPLLVFREAGIQGGVFDPGVTDAFVHSMPDPAAARSSREQLDDVFLKWQARVRAVYYAG